MTSRRLALVVSIAIVSAFVPTVRAFNVTASAGGPGGTLFTINCPSDEVLVGVMGRSGALIDSLRPLCAAVEADGTWTSTPQHHDQFAGGPGGDPFDMRCPSGQVVSGIQGRADALVDRLEILCSGMVAGRLRSAATAMPGTGSTVGGTPFGPFMCRNSEPGQGLTGARGSFITWIALICNLPSSLAQNDFVSVSNFTVAAVSTPGGGSSVFRVVLRNLTTSALSVPWRITRNGTEVIGSGTDSVPANSLMAVQLELNVPGGRSRFFAEADPSNTVSEMGFHRFNNGFTVDLSVPAAAVTVPATCTSGRLVTTPSGPDCAVGADVTSCSVPTLFGGSEAFRCSANSDCLPGFICSTNPCNGVCLRKG